MTYPFMRGDGGFDGSVLDAALTPRLIQPTTFGRTDGREKDLDRIFRREKRKMLSMNKTRTTPIGEFTAQIDPVLGKNIEAYLGISYAKAAPFALPEILDSYSEKPANTGCGIRFPQRDVPPLMNRFLKMPMMRPEILTNTDKTSDDAFVLNIWTSGTEEKRRGEKAPKNDLVSVLTSFVFQGKIDLE